jgi:hypothetical protein
MLTLLIWWVGVFFEALVLYRGLRGRTLAKYPFFYLYIASLFVSDAALYFLYLFSPGSYPRWNWNAGLLNILLGCGILLETFRHVLLPYPGAEKFARRAGLAVFAFIFSFVTVALIVAPDMFRSRLMNTHLERNLLAVQAVFLLCVVVVIHYYQIALGKNLRGMILGYGLCIGSTLMAFSFRFYAGPSFNRIWIYLQPLSYLFSLWIWTGAMWRFAPGPLADPAIPLESSYESFVSSTKGLMGAMRSRLTRSVARGARP